MASRQFYPEDGADRSVVYASTTLTVVKKEYAQLEKEGLAIIYDTKKFLYGGPFTNLYHSYLVRVNKYLIKNTTAGSRLKCIPILYWI